MIGATTMAPTVSPSHHVTQMFPASALGPRPMPTTVTVPIEAAINEALAAMAANRST